MITSTYNIYIHAWYSYIYYNYLLIKVRSVKILVLSIVSLQLAVSKSFSSDFSLFPYITKYILIDMNFVIFNFVSCLPNRPLRYKDY